MDIAELFVKLQNLANALRARNWVAVALVLADLAKAGLEWFSTREQLRAEGASPPMVAYTSPRATDEDALADWCQTQCDAYKQTVASGLGDVATFPWPLVWPVLRFLIEKMFNR